MFYHHQLFCFTYYHNLSAHAETRVLYVLEHNYRVLSIFVYKESSPIVLLEAN